MRRHLLRDAGGHAECRLVGQKAGFKYQEIMLGLCRDWKFERRFAFEFSVDGHRCPRWRARDTDIAIVFFQTHIENVDRLAGAHVEHATPRLIAAFLHCDLAFAVDQLAFERRDPERRLAA